MKVFEIKTRRSNHPYLVIASGFDKALKLLKFKGVYIADILSVRELDGYGYDDHILHEKDMTAREAIRQEVTAEVRKTMPRWKPEPSGGAAGGGERDVFLVRASKGHYYMSSCIGGDGYYLALDTLELLPGLPKED